MERPSKRFGWFILPITACLAVVILASHSISRASFAELRAGEVCEAAHDTPCATLRYRHALELYTPWSAASTRGLEGLIRLGAAQRRAGQNQGALLAYRSARLGIMSLRHVTTPFEDELPALEQAIAELAVPCEQVEQHRLALQGARESLPSPVQRVGIGLLTLGFLALALWWVALPQRASR
ncbi:MAG: hypothetical protein MUC50_13390 [Myxococcota bacterium]|jgi:hypothetical protein|nr:hypothetical protein [Myxococcota bacterium]